MINVDADESAPVAVDLSLELAEEIDLPGWIFVPEGLAADERELWLTEVTRELLRLMESEQETTEHATEGAIREVLEMGLSEREASESYVMYQVWPVGAAAAVMCHVNFVASDELPDWKDADGTVHAAQARYLGPGLQFSTSRALGEADAPVECSAVHFVFDDGSLAIVLSLEEALSQLLSPAIWGLTVLKDALRLTRADGTVFQGVAPDWIIEDSRWPEEQA